MTRSQGAVQSHLRTIFKCRQVQTPAWSRSPWLLLAVGRAGVRTLSKIQLRLAPSPCSGTDSPGVQLEQAGDAVCRLCHAYADAQSLNSCRRVRHLCRGDCNGCSLLQKCLGQTAGVASPGRQEVWQPRAQLAVTCPGGLVQAAQGGLFWYVGRLARPPLDGKSSCAVAVASCEQCCQPGSVVLPAGSWEWSPKQPRDVCTGCLAEHLPCLGKGPRQRLPRSHRYRGERGQALCWEVTK